MKGVTNAMRSMNKHLNLPQIQRIMNDFERQTEIMDMKEEMMSDAIDDAMDDADEEQETEAVVQQVIFLCRLDDKFINSLDHSSLLVKILPFQKLKKDKHLLIP